ncbi:endopeptidase [Streptococcus phage Javan377]|uniref:Prophage endopeptidase tail n=1 Tax=Streptococcus parasanguinis F0449 TaxID=1095733 RepID=I2NHK9_STRPA|nr:phage tail protein [Streptococcus parasanguinis]EIG25320.1 prophage endopeptidase tail [Streptococcus parasanguinis F0449]QBX17755.1 endopeptidase [Streptococcus phage Javan377]QBX17803.1 endopeptidase [Streptococcus phage Javan381]QBX27293.1 endopeptidase [Streptococcus phage Javan380]
MITFYDETGKGYGAQVELKTKNAVNGERSISGTIVSNKQVLSRLDRGWSFTFDGELYKIIYAKPKDEGKNISLSFDAVHQFFYDFEHSNCYKEFNGSNRFEVYIEAIFKDSGYRYVIEAETKAIRKENFGNAKRLKMFKEIIKAAGLEFSVTGKVVRILKKVGTDLSTVVRKNFNMNELTIEKNIGNFITYKKGLGAWKDENNHDAGRYTSEYESPLARIYGRIEGEPVSDERYKETGKLLERLKKEVDESYSISVQLGMEDLTQAGYKYTRPRAGDYIMAINETIGFREKIRIVSYESSYDVTGRLLSHKVTCNDIGTVQKAITSEGSIMRSVSESKEYAEGALEVATRALVSANGKNTNYYGATKPKDEPRGTLHEGDLLYLTVGEETELYYWSGTEWLPKILKVDTTKLEKLFNDTQVSTNQAIAQANAKAEDALKKAGTLPDTPTLSEQIKQQILSSPDLNRKVTETLNQTDGGVIYNKIYQNIKTDFVEQNDINQVLTSFSEELQAQVVEFNKLTESNKLYERIIGKSETDAPDKLSRLVMGSQIFQTEVGQYVNTNGANLLNGSKGPFKPDKKPANFDNNILYKGNTSIYMEQGQEYIVSAKTDGNFTAHHDGLKESDNVVLWIMDKDVRNYQIVSDLKTGTTGTKITWNKPTGTYHLRVNTYSKDPDKLKSVWDVKVEKGSIKSDYTLSLTDQLKADPLIEATRTQMSLLAGSWAVKNLNSNGDVLNSINVLADGTNRFDGRLTHITGRTVIDEAVIDGASIKSLSASKLSGGEADFAKMNVVNFDAKNVTSGTFTGLTFRGGLIEGLNGKMNIDLQNSQINILDNDAGINRQKGGFPFQFIRMINDTQITNRGPKNSTLTILGSNRDGTGMSHNSGFAGFRSYNSATDSLSEIVGDQVLIMTNNSKRSPWIFKAADYTDNHHRLIPSNENGTRHSIGRSDRRLGEIHVDEIYINGVRLKMALKDMLNRMGYRGTGNWGDNVN